MQIKKDLKLKNGKKKFVLSQFLFLALKAHGN